MAHTQLRTLFCLISFSASVQGAVIWSIGADDATQDGEGDAALNDPATLNGVAFNVSGVQENGVQALPGNPANLGGASGDPTRDIDDDYYFAGVYSTVVDGGDYFPVGEVAVSEIYYDRALTSGDPNMRWHFNVPNDVTETDTFTFTIDLYSLNEENPDDSSSFDLTFWVNGTQVGEMQSHSDFDLDSAQSWNFTLDDLGGEDQLGSGFDHYVEVRSSTTGSARWANMDYVQLEVNEEPPPVDDPDLPLIGRIDFGDVEVDSGETTETLELINSGETQNLTITEITLSGDDAAFFSIDAPGLPLVLGPGESSSVEVTLTAGEMSTALNATLSVASDDASDAIQNTVLVANVFEPFDGAGTLWILGADDNAQDGDGNATLNDPAFFNGVSFNVSGVRETGESVLPGSPANAGGGNDDVNRDVDDDYYFVGVYDTVTDGSGYTPVGEVPVSESFFDRALTNGDPSMRWHFNVPDSLGPNDQFTFTIDFFNLDEEVPADDSSYELSFYVDGKPIGEVQSHSDADLDAAQSWEFSLDDLGGTAQQGSGFDHYVEVRSQSTGSARWASLDYVQLAVEPGGNADLIISEFSVDPDNNNVTFQFRGNVGRNYLVDRSTSLLPSGQPGGWIEIEDSLEATEEIVSYTDFGAAEGVPKLFYRVREEE